MRKRRIVTGDLIGDAPTPQDSLPALSIPHPKRDGFDAITLRRTHSSKIYIVFFRGSFDPNVMVAFRGNRDTPFVRAKDYEKA